MELIPSLLDGSLHHRLICSTFLLSSTLSNLSDHPKSYPPPLASSLLDPYIHLFTLTAFLSAFSYAGCFGHEVLWTISVLFVKFL